MVMAMPKSKSSTSAEPDEPPRITQALLGQRWIKHEALLYGRDISLGRHNGLPRLYRGRVEAIHITANTVKVILVLTDEKISKPSRTRVIEVTS